jgi:uncharacterized protein DUF1064
MQAASKHRNKPITIDNIRFQSKREAARYQELKLLLREGVIHNLELQPRFDLIINHRFCGFYKADFRYISQDGKSITEDAKGRRLPLYVLKKRIVEALYGITITEV